MLSKSAARAFFLVGTLLCSGAFIALTVDTLGRVPAQTHADQLSEAVVRGKVLWEDNNCMGCHTLFGEGAYYAPDLSTVYARRGPMFIRQMLTDPAAMYPGRRQMVKYDFTEQEQDDLIAFFEWCGKVDLNGFPAPPTIGVAAAPVARATGQVQPEVFLQVCTACHSVEGSGGQVGPALDGVAQRMSPEQLTAWLQDPFSVRPNSRMPKLPLTSEQITTLVDYLSTLDGEAQP